VKYKTADDLEQINNDVKISNHMIRIRTKWWLQLGQFLCLRQHVTTTSRNIMLAQPKKLSGAYLTQPWPWPLTFWPQNLFLFAPMSVSDDSMDKFRQQVAKISCWQCLFVWDSQTDAHTHTQTLWKHNASGPLCWRRHTNFSSSCNHDNDNYNI